MPVLTLQPSPGIDTDVYLGTPTTSDYGNIIACGNLPSTNKTARGLIKFDISALPAGAIISSAILSLCVKSAYSSGSYTVYVPQISTAWDQYGVTWNTQPYIPASGPTMSVGGNGSWSSVDVTSFYQAVTAGTPNYGHGLKNSDEGSINGYKGFYGGSDTSAPSNRPKLVITYNIPPTKPVVTYPNGGETILKGTTNTITWTASTDTETAQASLRYQVQISTDNGASYSDIVALTAAGATSYAYDFASTTESTQCLIRVRAYDGSSYGDWDVSNAVFTVQYMRIALTGTSTLTADDIVCIVEGTSEEVLFGADTSLNQVLRMLKYGNPYYPDGTTLVKYHWLSSDMTMGQPEKYKLFKNIFLELEGVAAEQVLAMNLIVDDVVCPINPSNVTIPAGDGKYHSLRLIPPVYGAVLGRKLAVEVVSNVGIRSLVVEYAYRSDIPPGGVL